MKTNIDQLLSQVGGYFKDKLLRGEYMVEKISEHTATLVFNDMHRLKVWIANEPALNFEFYFATEPSSLVQGFKFANNEERSAAYATFKPHLDKYKQDVLISSKKYQLEKLQKELSELEKEQQ